MYFESRIDCIDNIDDKLIFKIWTDNQNNLVIARLSETVIEGSRVSLTNIQQILALQAHHTQYQTDYLYVHTELAYIL